MSGNGDATSIDASGGNGDATESHGDSGTELAHRQDARQGPRGRSANDPPRPGIYARATQRPDRVRPGSSGVPHDEPTFRLSFPQLSQGELVALFLAKGMMHQFRVTPFEPDLPTPDTQPSSVAPDKRNSPIPETRRPQTPNRARSPQTGGCLQIISKIGLILDQVPRSKASFKA